MRKFTLFFLSLLVSSGAALACDTGTAGIGISSGQGDPTYFVNVYAGSGQYNQTNQLNPGQRQEFCWPVGLGDGSLTKTDSTTQECSHYNQLLPGIAGQNYYLNVTVDDGNWIKGCTANK